MKLQIKALLEVKDLLEGYNIKGVYFLKNIYSDLEKMQLKKRINFFQVTFLQKS